ncbi:MAG: hypothetical protein ICV66_07400, partial [Chitinophagaceae bacterium]|nr:hypothetical protein [Chitinophagaceae bacterium]
FGNFSREEDAPEGEIYVSNPGGPGLWSYTKLPIEGFQESLENFLKGFGQDLDGEVYVLVSKNLGPSGNTGKVYKLVLAGKNK